MSSQLTEIKRARRPTLTPMIDVVFLLLIFFMLASSFERDVAIRVNGGAGNSAALTGPPRLIDIVPDDLRLNGLSVSIDDMASALDRVVKSRTDTIILRPSDGADLQRMVDVMSALRDQGFSALILLE